MIIEEAQAIIAKTKSPYLKRDMEIHTQIGERNEP